MSHHFRLRPALITLLLLGCGPDPASTTEGSETSATSAVITGSTGVGTTQSPTESQSTSLGPGTSTTSPTDSSAGSDTACTFLSCDDAGCGHMVPGLDGELRCSKCDVWHQDCPEGSKCSARADHGYDIWNDTVCSEVAPDPHKPGEPCKVEDSAVSGIDDCELGAMCWNVDPDTLIGTCVGLCDGSPRAPTCAEPNTTCFIAGEGSLNLCLPSCDPLASDCPEGQVCVDGNGGSFNCINGIPGAAGAACEFANACDPGLACINGTLVPGCDPAANNCCSPYCSLAAPTCPDLNQTCTPWFEPDQAPEGYQDVGVCRLPQ